MNAAVVIRNDLAPALKASVDEVSTDGLAEDGFSSIDSVVGEGASAPHATAAQSTATPAPSLVTPEAVSAI
jgi:hypothetical protein